jgi:hypothetical protein
MKDSQNAWYNFDEAYFTYNSSGLPEKRITIEFVHHDTIWTEVYYYNEQNLLTQSWTTRLSYNKLTDRNNIPSETMTYYYDDDQSYLNNVITKILKNSTWLNSPRSVYYYAFSFGSKLPICHNGHTIYVSRNALKAHLAHGDCLGECAGHPYRHKAGNKKSDIIVPEQSVNLSVSPADKDQILICANPATPCS